MRRKLPFILLFFIPLLAFKKKDAAIIRLKGYFIITSFNPKFPMCECGLNIPSSRSINNDSTTNSPCLCDGNYYKQIGYIHYISQNDLDLSKIDDYQYYISIEKKEHPAFLTTNAEILKDNYENDPAIEWNDSLVKLVHSDTVLAELVNTQLTKAKMVFSKSRNAYDVLMKGELSVLRLNDVPQPKDFRTDVLGAQYLLLNDPANTLDFVKVIKDPWGN